MAPQILTDLTAAVNGATTVEASATLLINGIAARVQAAVDAALANGATASDLAPLTDLVAGLNAASKSLTDAVVANTPVNPMKR